MWSKEETKKRKKYKSQKIKVLQKHFQAKRKTTANNRTLKFSLSFLITKHFPSRYGIMWNMPRKGSDCEAGISFSGMFQRANSSAEQKRKLWKSGFASLVSQEKGAGISFSGKKNIWGGNIERKRDKIWTILSETHRKDHSNEKFLFRYILFCF